MERKGGHKSALIAVNGQRMHLQKRRDAKRTYLIFFGRGQIEIKLMALIARLEKAENPRVYRHVHANGEKGPSQ